MKAASGKRVAKSKQQPEGRSVKAGDLADVLAVALPLLVAAVITNLPSVYRLGWSQSLFRSLVWIVTVAILLFDARLRRQAESNDAVRTARSSRRSGGNFFLRARSDRAILAALGVVALFAAISHYNFGRFHRDGAFLHYHEFYHYYMGSKYIPELGHDGLYAATHRALVENDDSLAGSIPLVKNLRSYEREGQAVSWERSASVARVFSERRWQEFREDVRFFQARIPANWWQFVLIDHGFNATPFWTMVASSLSTHLPLHDGSLYALAALDLLLIAAMLLLVRYAFGTKTCLLLAIFVFANFFGVFDITGGAFLRQLWLAALIGFVCFFKKGRLVLAGLCLAVAALDRVFPLLFGLLPAFLFVKETVGRRSLRHAQSRFIAALAGSLVLLGGLSAVTSGETAAWKGWYGKIRAHNQCFYINQIAMRNLFVVNPATAHQNVADGWNEASWWRERETLDARSRHTLLAVRALLLVLLVFLVVGQKDSEPSLALLSFTPFLLFYPANYYCVFLAVIIVCWQRAFWLALAMQALQGLFWLLTVAFATAAHLELLHWIVALCLVVTFLVFLTISLLQTVRRKPVLSRAGQLILAGGAVCLAGAVVADVYEGRADRDRVALDLVPEDVRSVNGAEVMSEQMARWGTGWSRNDHLVFMAQAPGAHCTINVPASRAGSHRVRIDYSEAPPFGVTALAVNGQAPLQSVDLYSPRVGIRPVVYEDIVLREGSNEFTFTVQGKHRASQHYHFALDRIAVDWAGEPDESAGGAASGQQRRRALDTAVSWVLANPADSFDGGRIGVCSEIVMLFCLASNPELSDDRETYIHQIERRFRQLNARPAYRTEPDEYEMLAAAAHVASRLKIDFPAFGEQAGRVRQWAESFYTDDGVVVRPLFLGAYLNRLDPAAAPAFRMDQSILYQEYHRRQLFGLMAGDVDSAKSLAVKGTLAAMSRDVCALIDFGQQALPRSEMFADRQFWAQLCDRAMRWATETGDCLTVARVVLMARHLNVDQLVPSFDAAIEFLLKHQEPDGSFGPTSPRKPNPFREGVLTAALAIAEGL